MNMNARLNPHTYRPYRGDEHLVVSFDLEDEKNEVKTREAGYAVYDPVEVIHIRMPGDKYTTIVAPVDSECTLPGVGVIKYRDRFPEDYERWKAGKESAVSGQPLKMAPFLDKHEVKMLNGLNIFTVEQLANMGGQPLRSMGPSGRKWQQQAEQFLASARGSSNATALAAENAELKDRLERLEAAISGGLVAAKDSVEEDVVEASGEYPGFSDVELKDRIEKLSGSRPRGNPSRETLVRSLKELEA
jgi:hypothetical protein